MCVLSIVSEKHTPFTAGNGLVFASGIVLHLGNVPADPLIFATGVIFAAGVIFDFLAVDGLTPESTTLLATDGSTVTPESTARVEEAEAEALEQADACALGEDGTSGCWVQ